MSNCRILTVSYDSCFTNLALEEALARTNGSEDLQHPTTVRFWKNPNSVVLGRFQEAASELDLGACNENQVKVVRRFTGGGAVFHDEGTLNFTILNSRSENTSALKFYEENLRLVAEALRNLGLDCSISAPNSILTDGGKLCGAAGALVKKSALWHCSIMVTTDTRLLELVLSPSKARATTRFVHSKWNPVTTVSKELSKSVDVNEVERSLRMVVQDEFSVDLRTGSLSVEEEECSKTLLARRYSTDEWNLYGNRRV